MSHMAVTKMVVESNSTKIMMYCIPLYNLVEKLPVWSVYILLFHVLVEVVDFVENFFS